MLRSLFVIDGDTTRQDGCLYFAVLRIGIVHLLRRTFELDHDLCAGSQIDGAKRTQIYCGCCSGSVNRRVGRNAGTAGRTDSINKDGRTIFSGYFSQDALRWKRGEG